MVDMQSDFIQDKSFEYHGQKGKPFMITCL